MNNSTVLAEISQDQNLQKVLATNCKIAELDKKKMLSCLSHSFNSSKEKYKLLRCTKDSVRDFMIRCTQLKLYPNIARGNVYPIPHVIKGGTGYTCEFYLGYRGALEIMLRSSQIKKVWAHVVYKGDSFKVLQGFKGNEIIESIIHEAKYETSEITFSYACAAMDDGSIQYEVIPKFELDMIRSKAPKSGAWADFPGEMSKKTAIKRLWKYVDPNEEMILAQEFEYEQDNQPSQEVEIVTSGVQKLEKLLAETKKEEPQMPNGMDDTHKDDTLESLPDELCDPLDRMEAKTSK